MKNSVHNYYKVRTHVLHSKNLNRDVSFDCIVPADAASAHYNLEGRINAALLLVNDGQLLEEVGFTDILSKYSTNTPAAPAVFTIGIYAGKERMQEYGISSGADYLGRGAKAAAYGLFIMEELLPWVRQHYTRYNFTQNYVAGFSLGGLSALDIAMTHSDCFKGVGVFSGSLWWRKLATDHPKYDDAVHRLAHDQLRKSPATPWMQYFFECGTEDESVDRNNLGIIDSIQDTRDFIAELVKKGIPASNYQYLEIEGGKHDMKTWAIAWPYFFDFILTRPS